MLEESSHEGRIVTPPTRAAAEQRLELEPGKTFAGRFRIERFLAQGGMGTVWEATDTEATAPDSARIALKVMTTWGQASEKARERFRREIALVSGLVGPYFPRVVTQGFQGAIPYLALEFLEGETLAARLAKVGRLAPSECARVCDCVCAALAEAHSLGVVHRDVSPQNIFLLADGGLKILDFGIAKHTLFEAKLTEPGMLMGTPHYMSPEQIRKAQAVDARSDLWATAAVLYRCLLGRAAFEGKQGEVLVKILRDTPTTPSTILPVGEEVDSFFEMALAKDPGGRFHHAPALAAAFRSAVADLSDLTPRPSQAPVPRSLPPDRTAVAEVGYESYAEHVDAWKSSAPPPPAEPRQPGSDFPTRPGNAPVAPLLNEALGGLAMPPLPLASPLTPSGVESGRPRGILDWTIPVPVVFAIVLLTNFVTWLLVSRH